MISVELVRMDKNNTFVTTQVFESAPQVYEVLARCDWADVQLADAATDPGWFLSIWGRRASLLDRVKTGDRVELTRGLEIDPKRARAHKVAQKPRRGWVKRMV